MSVGEEEERYDINTGKTIITYAGQEETTVLTEEEILNGSGKNYKERLDLLRELYLEMKNRFKDLVMDHGRGRLEIAKLETMNERLWRLVERQS